MIHLYVKTHRFEYFGKTTKDDYVQYRGSGKYWSRHIKAHGYDVSTILIKSFNDEDIDECSIFAIEFSQVNNIVKSESWANLREENGLDGAPVGTTGVKFSDDVINDMSEKLVVRWEDQEYRERVSNSFIKSWSPERKLFNSVMMKTKWTEDRKSIHSNFIQNKWKEPEYRSNVVSKLKGLVRTTEQRERISNGLKGVPKSPEHIQNLKAPKTRVTRILDRKEMAVNHFTRWINKLAV